MKSNEELIKENEAIQQMLDSGIADQLKKIPGVVHVAPGMKQKGDRLQEEICIRVYVQAKKAESELEPSEIVPKEINGIKTDVNIVGEVAFSMDSSKYRPIIGGCQISNRIIDMNEAGTAVAVSRGTLGCMAIYNKDKSHVMLSNWHVMMANRAAKGDKIYQPGPSSIPPTNLLELPKKPADDDNVVGEIVDFKITNKVDGAIAKINECYSLCCRCCGVGHRDEIHELNRSGTPSSNSITGKVAAAAGQVVYKVGMTTGWTKGRVVTNNFPDFTIPRRGVNYSFSGQIQIQCEDPTVKFSDEGDSGSVIVTADNKIIGLLFASGHHTQSGQPTEYFTVANHINDVEAALDIKIIFAPGTNHTSGEPVANDRVLPNLFSDDDITHLQKRKNELLQHSVLKELYDKASLHHKEIVELVNQCRPVTITWHRNQGPAFLSYLIKHLKNESTPIPTQVKGVRMQDLLRNMHLVLIEHGSEVLANDLRNFGDMLIHEQDFTSIEELAKLILEKYNQFQDLTIVVETPLYND